MKYFFETYGCQMNKAESSSFEQLLLARSWIKATTEYDADLICINTCSVRATAESRIHGRLGRYTALRKERGDSFTLVVMGCMAERLGDDLKKQFKVVDYVAGTSKHGSLISIVQAVENNIKLDCLIADDVYCFDPISYENGMSKAYVPIMQGCNNFCTYCIVPHVRGREISRSPKEILAEIDMLSVKNVKEITVLGQNVNSYHWDASNNMSWSGFSQGGVSLGSIEMDVQSTAALTNKAIINFPGLMKIIAQHIRKTHSSIQWVRFMSSHPKDISKQLIDVMAQEPVICRHVHLPMQHGSNKILKKMNRRYTREKYVSIVNYMKEKMPNITLTTDIMMGFPGETEEDVTEVFSLMELVRFQIAYMYYFN
ncbi:MAG TPA: MiaB/RimO family radical SAM methylthiotransferase, partial [Treponemataceae bacterium]|nr:MiaB/RimO family radical SAM methylthiotransferase [Treponemataceae bacterium]